MLKSTNQSCNNNAVQSYLGTAYDDVRALAANLEDILDLYAKLSQGTGYVTLEDTYNDLRKVDPTIFRMAIVRGRDGIHDDAGGMFYWQENEPVENANDGTVIAPENAQPGQMGAWVRDYDRANYSLFWFGGSHTSTDNLKAEWGEQNAQTFITNRQVGGWFEFDQDAVFGHDGVDNFNGWVRVSANEQDEEDPLKAGPVVVPTQYGDGYSQVFLTGLQTYLEPEYFRIAIDGVVQTPNKDFSVRSDFKVIFVGIPPEGCEIDITYYQVQVIRGASPIHQPRQYGDGNLVNFNIPGGAYSKLGLSVFIQGVYQGPDAYTIDIEKHFITFEEAPEPGDTVEVIFYQPAYMDTRDFITVESLLGVTDITFKTLENLKQGILADGTQVTMQEGVIAKVLNGGQGLTTYYIWMRENYKGGLGTPDGVNDHYLYGSELVAERQRSLIGVEKDNSIVIKVLEDGELVRNWDDNSVHIGDGVTPGGHKIFTDTRDNPTDILFYTLEDLSREEAIYDKDVSLVSGDICRVTTDPNVGDAAYLIHHFTDWTGAVDGVRAVAVQGGLLVAEYMDDVVMSEEHTSIYSRILNKGELIRNSVNNALHVGDGVTPGGTVAGEGQSGSIEVDYYVPNRQTLGQYDSAATDTTVLVINDESQDGQSYLYVKKTSIFQDWYPPISYGRGPKGDQGLKGEYGETGVQGDVGPTGPQGPTGTDGQDGLDGSDGVQGPIGPTGAIGVQGPAGPQGVVGPQGIEGEVGPKGDLGLTGPQGDQGETGATGVQGPKGDVGATGPQGEIGLTGPQGETGLQGPTGEIGPEGPQGPIGLQGTQGVQGDKGDKGDLGPIGLQGPQGTAGLEGPTGVKGDTGDVGDTGPQGSEGPQGIQGVKGDTGATGPQGDEGPQGIQGIQGVKGNTGNDGSSFTVNYVVPTKADLSAYDAELEGVSVLVQADESMDGTAHIYFKASNTSGDWQPGIPFGRGEKGEKGDTGDQGIQGAKGDTGTTGAAGEKGDTGDQGPQGIQGLTGGTGPAGEDGLTGATGAQGPEGVAGIQGPEGAEGATGGIGLTGPEGPQGPQGEKGDIGATGPEGPQGITGATGLTGAKGDTGATGAEGPQGIQGDTGLAGATGPKGDAGVAGNDGATGPKGNTGDTGPQGPAGGTGPQGLPGNDGADGAVGVKGDTGPQGPKGDDGADGSNGLDGPEGPEGPRGNAGPQGLTGATGPAGTAGADGADAQWEVVDVLPDPAPYPNGYVLLVRY